MENTLNFTLVNLADDGELRASTEAIAFGYEAKHKNVLALVDKYLVKFNTLGTVAFQTRQSGGPQIRYAQLNQPQSMFLLTLMRNTAKVVDFKLKLTQEFIVMADRLRNHELTLWQRRIKFEEKDQRSKAIGTIGSLMMTKRRIQKKPLDAERFMIEAEMQPSIFVN